MTRKPRRSFEKRLSTLATIAVLAVVPTASWASESFYREFLDGPGIIAVSGEKLDEHQARINSIQITHDQFHELRVLNPNSGETEILEYSDPKTKVTYTLPLHGKFLKLKIEHREKTGVRTANFILASDKARYVLVRQNFKRYQVLYQTVDLSGIGTCQMPQPKLINAAGFDPVIDKLVNSPKNIATRCLDSSCQQEPFMPETESIIAGISLVVGSRDSKTSSGGRFLACLKDKEKSNLGAVAAELENYFNSVLAPTAKPTAFCQNTKDVSRGDFLPEENRYESKTSFNKPWSYLGNASPKLIPESDAVSAYADNFFHENLHRAGIEDEKLVKNIVSCCGLEKPNGDPKACQQMRDTVEQTNNRNARLKASVDKLDGFTEFWIKLEKATDDERAAVFYDDYLNHLGADVDKQKNSLASCLGAAAKSANLEAESNKCTQSFSKAVEGTIDSYFENNCANKFKDKPWKERAPLCQNLRDDAKNLFQKNLTKVCDPAQSTTIGRSCLYATINREAELLKGAKENGALLDDPDELEQGVDKPERDRTTDSFLTSFSNQIPALKNIYQIAVDKLNTNSHDDRAKAIMYQMIQCLGKTTNKMREEYDSCLSSGNDKSKCASDVRHLFTNGRYGLNRFFRRVCPTYFTDAENAKTRCERINKVVGDAFNASFSGGCKTTDPAKLIGTPEVNLTCLFDAVDEGKYNYANYEELKKAGKMDGGGALMNASTMQSALTPWQKVKEVAGEASEGKGPKPQSVSLADKAPASTDGKTSNRSSGYSHRGRSPTSSQGPVINVDQLQSELSLQPSPVSKILQDANQVLENAGHVLADAAIPKAQAENRSAANTQALAIQAPVSFSNRATIAGDLEVVATLNAGMTNSTASAPRDSGSSKNAASAAKGQTQGQAASSKVAGDGRPGSASDKQAGRSPASTDQAAKSGKGSSSKGSQGTAASAAGKVGLGGSEKALGHSEEIKRLQHQLLKHFRDNPQDALMRLKSKALSRELALDRIQAVDDEGQAYGSDSPQITIRYDKTARIFRGLPDDL
jgi:hypothetical protein